jgi:hypothetical protein
MLSLAKRHVPAQKFLLMTHTQGGSWGKVWSACIYICYIYIYVIYILLYIQGGKHAASACKGGTYPHKEGSTRKRERMICGDTHKRKITLVYRGRTRA